MTNRKKKTGAGIDVKLILLYALFLLFPLVIHQLLFWLSGYGFKFFRIIPVLNDEVSWWSQINAILTAGKPLGYYGYNGTHAPVGTIGAWGIAPLIPYVIFGKIFGWEIYSMAYANILFLSLGGFIFCLLAKPDRKQLRWIFVLYACSFFSIGYSMTAMAEGMRYAMGLVLIGMVVWLRNNPPDLKALKIKNILMYLLILCFLYFSINVYLVFALMALPIAWFMLKKLKPLIRFAVSLVFTAGITLLAYKATFNVIAPYTSSFIKSLIEVLQTEGIYKGLAMIFTSMMQYMLPVNLFTVAVLDSDVAKCYMVIYHSIIILATVLLIKGLYEKKLQNFRKNAWPDIFNGNTFLVIYLTFGFFAAYCALYPGSYWTLVRGINTGLLMAFMLIAMGETREEPEASKFHIIRVVVLSLTIIGFPCIWAYYQANVMERIETIDRIPIIAAEKETLSNVLEIGPDNSTWDNTIAHYGELDDFYLALPDAAGINSLDTEKENTEARYVVYRSTEWPERIEAWEEILKDSGHHKIHEDDLFVVYERGAEEDAASGTETAVEEDEDAKATETDAASGAETAAEEDEDAKAETDAAAEPETEAGEKTDPAAGDAKEEP